MAVDPVYICGFSSVGLVLVGLALWLAVRYYRKHRKAQRDDERGAAFLSVRGLVRDTEKGHNHVSPFSRNQMSPSVVLPSRAVISQPIASNRDVIFRQHQEAGTMPRPFSFAISASSSPTLRMPGPPSGPARPLSGASSFNRFSVLSASSVSSIRSGTGHARKVRQLFDPVLPDELLITNVGERLTIVQSFDDGWCVVGREASAHTRAAATPRSLFQPTTPAPAAQPDVELGVVPAWCFLKPVKGLRAERPIRGSSLGVTVQMQGPGFSSREEVMSWSNF